jgi:hypothetical protein
VLDVAVDGGFVVVWEGVSPAAVERGTSVHNVGITIPVMAIIKANRTSFFQVDLSREYGVVFVRFSFLVA